MVRHILLLVARLGSSGRASGGLIVEYDGLGCNDRCFPVFTVAIMRHLAAFIVRCNFGSISCSLAPALVAEFLTLVRVSYDSSSLVFSVSFLFQSCHVHIYMHIDVALRYSCYNRKPRISSTLCHISTT